MIQQKQALANSAVGNAAVPAAPVVNEQAPPVAYAAHHAPPPPDAGPGLINAGFNAPPPLQPPIVNEQQWVPNQPPPVNIVPDFKTMIEEVRKEIEKLQEQIKQSESNLSAQHQVRLT